MALNPQWTPTLRPLRRSGLLATLEARHRPAIDGHWASVAGLERVLDDEIARKTPKTLAAVDGSVNPTENRQQGRPLTSGDDLRQPRHVVRWGPTGVGHSHRVHALAHAACRPGCDGLVINTHPMLQHLPSGRADRTWAKRLQRDLRAAWRVLDDCGLHPLGDPAPSDLAEVMHERDDVGRLLVTSHRAPTAWLDRCGKPRLAAAGWDRRAPWPGPRAPTLYQNGRCTREGQEVTPCPTAEEPSRRSRPITGETTDRLCPRAGDHRGPYGR